MIQTCNNPRMVVLHFSISLPSLTFPTASLCCLRHVGMDGTIPMRSDAFVKIFIFESLEFSIWKV